jgi:glycosyltransferase involved in cell wall biosynthesis
MRAEYETLAKQQDLSEHISFSGLVTHKDLPALLNEQDIFVMPSVAPTESFCIAAAEAQACGLPAIVSDLPGLRQTIGVGETGLVFPVGSVVGLADCIATLMAGKETYQQFSVAARERMVKRFAWPEVAKMALTAYRIV